ncbi:MAG TPA: branched-chain amino acid ABC transporter permease [bacterium]|nr:branched-chain amino acid ABC transporter permease [bacterium]
MIPQRGRSRGLTGAALGGVAFALVLPLVAGTYYVRVVTGIFMFAMLASGWNLIGGYTGYPDFGAAAFIGIGAYATGILMLHAHIAFALALLAGGALSVGAAAGMGSVLLRLRGHYFAVATLGFMIVLEQLAANLEITGGGSGMNLPVATSFTTFYYWMLSGLVAAMAAGWALPRLRAGYAIAAIRENQDAARVLGIPPLPYKVLAYAGSAFFFGIGGGIYAYWFTFIDPPTVFNVDFTIQAIVMTLFGGPGTALGPLVGAVILKSLDVILTNVSVFFHNVFFGALVCLLVIFAPRGLAELLRTRGGLVEAIRTELRENRL